MTEDKLKRLKRIQADEKRHKIRELWIELEHLWEVRRKTPLVKLDKPERNGYRKFFVLREDISRRRDAEDFRTILKVINSRVYSRDNEFKIHRKCYKKDHRGRLHKKKEIVSIPHYLRVIPMRQWEALNWPPRLRKHFYFGTQIQQLRSGFNQTYQGYIFVHPYYFDTQVEEHFIEYVFPHDADLESQIDKLNNKLYRDNLWPKIDHMLRGSSNHREWKIGPIDKMDREIGRYKDMTIQEEFDEEIRNKFIAQRYGYEITPWDDPNYKF